MVVSQIIFHYNGQGDGNMEGWNGKCTRPTETETFPLNVSVLVPSECLCLVSSSISRFYISRTGGNSVPCYCQIRSTVQLSVPRHLPVAEGPLSMQPQCIRTIQPMERSSFRLQCPWLLSRPFLLLVFSGLWTFEIKTKLLVVLKSKEASLSTQRLK